MTLIEQIMGQRTFAPADGNGTPPAELHGPLMDLLPVGACDGYLSGEAGMDHGHPHAA